MANVYVFSPPPAGTVLARGPFSVEERGSPNTPNYRMFFRNQAGNAISPFHDIPLLADKQKNIFNMVVEIPRWTNAKMEVCKDEPLNPIKQDVKKGKLRFVKNIFPHKGYIWNYGALPQTYEDPDVLTEDTGANGDGDPIDVCEIGFKVHERGAVVQVKVLGVMALIDEGETDWKVLAIDVTDPMADQLDDIEDVKKHCPGLLKKTYEWFRYYKVPDGKPENAFAFDGDFRDKEYALKVIDETNGQWKEMMHKESEHSISRTNVSVENSPNLVKVEDAQYAVDEAAPVGAGEPESQDVHTWHFVIPRTN